MGQNIMSIPKYIWHSADDFFKFQNPYNFQQKPRREYNYSLYKKKKFYKENITEQQFQKHFEMIKKKEDLIKQFKFHQQIERYGATAPGTSASIEYNLEFCFYQGLLSLLLFSRIWCIKFAHELTNQVHFYNTVTRAFLPFLCFFTLGFMISSNYQLFSHSYYTHLFPEMSFYIECDQEVDVYQDVEQTKYIKKQPSYWEFHSFRRKYYANTQIIDGKVAQNYYERIFFGLTDQYDDFLSERQVKRKKQIQLNLQKRKQKK